MNHRWPSSRANTAASAATGNEIDRGSPPGAAAALRCSQFGRLLAECIHPVSAPPYGRREPRREVVPNQRRMVSTGSVGRFPSGISHLPAPACAQHRREASAGGLLNELEYRYLLLCVEPIPCLREPDTALGPERL